MAVGLVASAAAVLLFASTAACDAVNKALDCGEFAVDITTDATELSQALAQADQDPQGALDALRELERDTDKLGERSDNADVDRAVEDLATQITETQQALDAGRVPSARPVMDAASEVAKVCTPG
ncbi:hypothetical protein [Wenjunlia vitaminophila]|uniref:hypothetical protein n=1 Tax=Wenjunlia vitaminophila TaxID=76728 RepID=UPI0003A0A0F2|nr:hypothetical protein [Wenjunlia vitaminophila]